VVWYTFYNYRAYFYVVSGQWDGGSWSVEGMEGQPPYKMGLVDETGKVIIPVQYQMIGTLGARVENAVEVKGENGYGYYSLEGKVLVKPSFSHIIPYPNGVGWIVQRNGKLEWVNRQGVHSNEFPISRIKNFVKNFWFLPDQTVIDNRYSLCTDPHAFDDDTGTFISPSYWAKMGVSEPIVSNVSLSVNSGASEQGLIAYSKVEEAAHNVTVITRQLGKQSNGTRNIDEFTIVLFMNTNHRVLLRDTAFHLRDWINKMEDTVEVSFGPRDSETPTKTYKYYKIISGDKVISLKSNREYPETEFVKLHDGYLYYSRWVTNPETEEKTEEVYPKDPETLQQMRNDILASYGFIFLDDKLNQIYSYKDWYKPRYNTEQELEPFLSSIDKYNLKYLAELLDGTREINTN
jgi:hypothetical protein